MKLSQLVKFMALVSIVLPLQYAYADCSACDSANPDSNAETQQEPDDTADSDTDDTVSDSYYLKHGTYSSALTSEADSDAPQQELQQDSQ